MNETRSITAPFDRTAEDIGNIVELGHVNVRVPDRTLATQFYVTGLGLTRDPYLLTGVDNMWVNVGRSQFHLPTGPAQILRGITGLVIPDRQALLDRLIALRSALAGTRFDFHETSEAVEVTCPWGNRVRCHAPDTRFGRIILGMAYVEFDVPPDNAEAIARFYRDFLGTTASVGEDAQGRAAYVAASAEQSLVFREGDGPRAGFDGHHIQITLADFSGPHRLLRDAGLITEESSQHQYRFQDIVDPDSGRVIFTVEHEVRSMRHPLYARALVNRDPRQTVRTYRTGRDALAWSIPFDA
jgi:hypothetical protein